MKPTSFAALICQAMLASSLLCQTTQAQSVVLNVPGTAILAANGDDPANELTVTYEVTFASGIYTYDYNVSNPGTDSALVETFSIGFNANAAGAVVSGPTGGVSQADNGISGLEWTILTEPNQTSGTLSFESSDAPVFGNANATGSPIPASPWASSPNGQQVPIPSNVPEPATTALLTLTLLLLPFRSVMRKKT